MRGKEATLFFKLLGVLLVLVALPLTVAAYRTYQLLSAQFTSTIEENLSTRAEELTSYIDNWAEMNLRMVRQNTSLDAMTSMAPKRQVPILRSIAKEYGQWVTVANTFDITGMNIARSDNETLKNYSDRAWFREVMQGKVGFDLVISRTYGRPSWILAVPIHDANKKIIGAFAMASFISSISDIVGATRIGQTGYSFVISDKGRVVAHAKKELTQGMADFSKHPALLELGIATKKKIAFIDSATNKKIIAYAQRSKFNWIIVVQQDVDEAYAPLNQATRLLLLAIAATLFVTGIAAWYLAKRYQHLVIDATKSASNPIDNKTRFGLFPGLALVIAVLIIVSLGTNWAIVRYDVTQRLNHQIEQQLSARSDALTRYVDMWFEMSIKLLNQNVLLDDIKSMDAKRQLPILKAISKEYPWAWVRTMLPNGQDLVRSDDEKLKNYADRDYFQNAIKGALSTDILIGKTTGKPTLVLSLPIIDNKQKIVGVFTMSSVIANLSDAIVNLKNGHGYLLNEKGKLIAHQKKAFNQALLDFSKFPPYMSLAQTNKNKVTFVEESSGKQIFSYAQRAKQGWVVVVQIEKDESYGLIEDLNRNILIILLTSLLLLLPIMLYIARYLAPITRDYGH